MKTFVKLKNYILFAPKCNCNFFFYIAFTIFVNNYVVINLNFFQNICLSNLYNKKIRFINNKEFNINTKLNVSQFILIILKLYKEFTH